MDAITLAGSPSLISEIFFLAENTEIVVKSCHRFVPLSMCMTMPIEAHCGTFFIHGASVKYHSCTFQLRAPPRLYIQLLFAHFEMEIISLALRGTVFNSTKSICMKFNHLLVAYSDMLNFMFHKLYYCGYLPPFNLTLMNNKMYLEVSVSEHAQTVRVEFSHQVSWPPQPSEFRPVNELFAVLEGGEKENIVARKEVSVCYTCVISTCVNGHYWSNFAISSIPFYRLKLVMGGDNKISIRYYVFLYDGPTGGNYNFINLSWLADEFLPSSHLVLLTINTEQASSENFCVTYTAIERVTNVYVKGGQSFWISTVHSNTMYTVFEMERDEKSTNFKKNHGAHLNYRSRIRLAFHFWIGYADPVCLYGGLAITRVQSGLKNIIDRPFDKSRTLGEFQSLCGDRLPTVLSDDDIVPIFALVPFQIVAYTCNRMSSFIVNVSIDKMDLFELILVCESLVIPPNDRSAFLKHTYIVYTPLLKNKRNMNLEESFNKGCQMIRAGDFMHSVRKAGELTDLNIPSTYVVQYKAPLSKYLINCNFLFLRVLARVNGSFAMFTFRNESKEERFTSQLLHDIMFYSGCKFAGASFNIIATRELFPTVWMNSLTTDDGLQKISDNEYWQLSIHYNTRIVITFFEKVFVLLEAEWPYISFLHNSVPDYWQIEFIHDCGNITIGGWLVEKNHVSIRNNYYILTQ